jgi:pyruvate decarboxylase
MLTGDSAVIAETGDCWLNCQKLKLPDGCGYEFQMQYDSIRWSVGEMLGYAQDARNKRVIACVRDGSFQVGIHFLVLLYIYIYIYILFIV